MILGYGHITSFQDPQAQNYLLVTFGLLYFPHGLPRPSITCAANSLFRMLFSNLQSFPFPGQPCGVHIIHIYPKQTGSVSVSPQVGQ